jgi:hypothetical protein
MNRNTTIVLVLVAAALALYVFLVQRPKEEAAANATGTPGTTSLLWTVSVDQVTGLRVLDRANSREMVLAKDAGGAWSVVMPAGQVTDQAAAASAVSALTSLTVDSTITTTTDLTAFGVLSPTYTIEVSLADGSKLKASVGDKSPTGSSYYVLREGETNVVTVSSFAIEALTIQAERPPIVAPTATETATLGTGTPEVTGTPPTELASTASPAATGTQAAATPSVTRTLTATVAVTATARVTATATQTP